MRFGPLLAALVLASSGGTVCLTQLPYDGRDDSLSRSATKHRLPNIGYCHRQPEMMPAFKHSGCPARRSHAAHRHHVDGASSEEPSVVVGIGTMKGSTTSLHASYKKLETSGLTCFPKVKELNYWYYSHPNGTSSSAFWELYDDARQPTRDRGCEIAIDISPQYMEAPYAAGRICSALPRPVIVALLRHPVDRAWSHFRHMNNEQHGRLFRWQCSLEASLKACDHQAISADLQAAAAVAQGTYRKAPPTVPGLPGCPMAECPLSDEEVLERHVRREIAALHVCHSRDAFDPSEAHLNNPLYVECLAKHGWEAAGVPDLANPFHFYSALQPGFWEYHRAQTGGVTALTDDVLKIDFLLVARGLYHEQLAPFFRVFPPEDVFVQCSESFNDSMGRLVNRTLHQALRGGDDHRLQALIASELPSSVHAFPVGTAQQDGSDMPTSTARLLENYYESAGLLRGLKLLLTRHVRGASAPNAGFGDMWADLCSAMDENLL